jgi:hypothetical protein
MLPPCTPTATPESPTLPPVILRARDHKPVSNTVLAHVCKYARPDMAPGLITRPMWCVEKAFDTGKQAKRAGETSIRKVFPGNLRVAHQYVR